MHFHDPFLEVNLKDVQLTEDGLIKDISTKPYKTAELSENRGFLLSFVLELGWGSFKVCVPALPITPTLHHIHYPQQKSTPQDISGSVKGKGSLEHPYVAYRAFWRLI